MARVTFLLYLILAGVAFLIYLFFQVRKDVKGMRLVDKLF